MTSEKLSLVQLHAETLFVHNGNGRLLFVNEPVRPEDDPAPLVFIGRTTGGSLCRFRHDLAPALCHEVETLAARPDLAPLAANPALIGAVRRCLEAAGFEITGVFDGPAFTFPADLPAADGCVLVEPTNARLLARHFASTIPELGAVQPCVVAAAGGDAVAICHTVRRSTRAVEAGVETVAAYRRSGLGASVVARWAALVRAAGMMPMYSTSWDNTASRALAARLKLVQYGTDLSFSGGKNR